MNWWNIQVKVGFVVIVGFIFLAILLYQASNSPWSAGGDLLRTNFSFINDLLVGDAVHLAGVPIGKVTRITLNEAGDRVEVQMRVKKAFQRLRRGCTVKIGISGFVGEAYIDLTNGPVGNPPLQPTDMPLTGEDPMGVLGILERAEEAVAQAIQLAESANQLIQSNQTHINAGITDIRKLIEQTSGALEKIIRST
ncbi:MAG: MlaD family protein, partial [Candidatus Poribacteria bacterium]|nr:MlaD family protein [Candidatus Poribacteria bacterium]